MAFDRDLALRQFIKIYSDAYDNLLDIIANKEAKGNVTNFQESLLKDVDNELKKLDRVSQKYSVEVIPRSYKNSRDQVLKLFDDNNIGYDVADNFGKVHKDAVKVLQENFYNNMQNAHSFIGRELRDKIRKAQLEVTEKKLTTGQTIKQTKENLIRKLSNQGIASYTDSAGRKWTLDRYAEMSARTVTAEATNKGTFNQLRSMDRDLVQLSSHSSPCPVCAPLEGRVYSLSGNSERFPSITNALPNRYGVIHPNCVHRFMPYVAELADNVERDVKKSNRPFDEDPRTEKAKEAYRRNQKVNKLLRKEKRLTYRLKGLSKGTDEYKEVNDKLKKATSTRRDLERKKSLEDAEFIDEIWRIK